MLTLGVLADTHVPDRARHINPGVIPVLREAGAAAILHAGDICTPEVLEQLEEIAPVYAVQGNRDIWRLSHLPMRLSLEFEGVSIGLTHGHGGFLSYFSQKLSYLIDGYQLIHYQNPLREAFPTAQVIIFGHTHCSENTWSEDVLIFNPGPASNIQWGKLPPSMGLLHILDGGDIRGEVITLDA
jgi:putative phosphoesterase